MTTQSDGVSAGSRFVVQCGSTRSRRAKTATVAGRRALVAVALLVGLMGLVTVAGVVAAPASGAQVSRDTVGPAKPDFVTGNEIADMVLDQFDPARGTLLGANLVVEAAISSEFSEVANDSSATADLTPQVNLDFCADFAASAAVLPSDSETSATGVTGTLTAAETFTDVGPNGSDIRASAEPVTESAATVVALAGSQLDAFIGTGQVAVRFAADASIDMTGPGDGQMAWHTLASGAVSVEYIYAGVDVEKSTNGHDADVDPVTLTVGDPVEWTYTVTNTGVVDLVPVRVDDDLIGSICVIDRLVPGATRTCSWSGTAVAGGYVNLATVTGTPDVESGDDQSVTVTDDDPSRYIGVEPTPVPAATEVPQPTAVAVATPTPDPDGFGLPAVDIELATNGRDADQPKGPKVQAGAPITWSFVVTNTGTVDLVDLVVTDDAGAAVCDRPLLAYGHTFTCTRSGIGESGDHRLVATVSAKSQAGAGVSDVDPTHWHDADEVLATATVEAEEPDEVLAHTGDAGTIVTIIALAASALGLVALSASDTLRRRECLYHTDN